LTVEITFAEIPKINLLGKRKYSFKPILQPAVTGTSTAIGGLCKSLRASPILKKGMCELTSLFCANISISKLNKRQKQHGNQEI
jgi:hypothetical protein